MLKPILIAVGIALTCSVSIAQTSRPGTGAYDVTAFGAAGDGKTKDTAAFQKAIDTASAEGGGTVRVPRGTFLIGTIFLKDGVALEILRAATIIGSTDHADYPKHKPPFDAREGAEYCERSLIAARDVHDVAVIGEGTIDGRGGAPSFNISRNQAAGMRGHDLMHIRPYVLSFVKCQNVTVKGLTLKNSAFWMQTYLNCENVSIDGLTIRNLVNANNDGIDIDGSRRVRISNCDIRSGDDALCFKSLFTPCDDIVVSNCILSSDCNGLKCGTQSTGGFRNMSISNISIVDTRLSGIALEVVDGGTMENVVIRGVSMRNVANPIFIRLGNRAREWDRNKPKPGVGAIRQIVISDVAATVGAFGRKGNPIPSHITGQPGHPVQDVTLSNIRITCVGGATKEQTKLSLDKLDAVPEKETAYPEYPMFGDLPAYGFYFRHVDGISLNDVRVGCPQSDWRPALVCDDVKNLELDAFKAQTSGQSPLILLNDVTGAMIRGCTAPTGTSTFAAVRGKSADVALIGNDLRNARKFFERGESAGPVLER